MVRSPAMTNAMTAQATRSSASVNPCCERTRARAFIAVPSGSRGQHDDDGDLPLLAQVAAARDRLVEDGDRHQLAVGVARRARRARVVLDPRRPPVGRRPANRPVGLGDDVSGKRVRAPQAGRRRMRRGAGGVEARDREVLELLEALLGEEGGLRLPLAGLDPARRVLEARRDGQEADREHERRHEHLGEREPALHPPSEPEPSTRHCTLTCPAAETTTSRVLPVAGWVTRNVAAVLAAPRFVKTMLAPLAKLTCMPPVSLISPAAVVPIPVKTVPAHPPVRSVIAVPLACAQTVVLRETARWRPRVHAAAGSSAAAWSVETCPQLIRR